MGLGIYSWHLSRHPNLQTFSRSNHQHFWSLQQSFCPVSQIKRLFPTHILSEKYEEHPKTPTNNNDTSYCCKKRGQKSGQKNRARARAKPQTTVFPSSKSSLGSKK